MKLWAVDVAGVSRRYVESESRRGAEDLVRTQIAEAIRVRAEAAPKELVEAYREAGPIQRKNMIARLDGLYSRVRKDSLQRQVRRLQDQLAAEEAWLADQDTTPLPPIDAARLARLLELAEIDHIRRAVDRLHGRKHGPFVD